jgi:uncharacterized protein
MGVQIHFNRERIAEFCRKHQIEKLAFFGSVLRNDFRPDSDVDVLVSFAPGAPCSLFKLVRIGEELGTILGRRVDLIEREAVEQSENYIRRRYILETEEPVYVAG